MVDHPADRIGRDVDGVPSFPVASRPMPTALEAIAATPPAEFGGPNASTGHSYQRSWTVCRIIDLHKADIDYLVVCDYHDDVLVLEGGLTGERVDFYQIKTTNMKPWTLTRLTTQGTGRSGNRLPSVLGKLLRHKQVFKDAARRLAVVCNLPFSIDTREGADVRARRRVGDPSHDRRHGYTV